MSTNGGISAAEKDAAHGAANAGTQPKPQTERAGGTTEATAARSETSGVQLHGPTGILTLLQFPTVCGGGQAQQWRNDQNPVENTWKADGHAHPLATDCTQVALLHIQL